MIIYSIATGPAIDAGDAFCGFVPRFAVEGVLDSSVLGTYDRRFV
jgi:hypothetical protein